MTVTRQQIQLSHAQFREASFFARNCVHDYKIDKIDMAHYMQNATGPADLATMATGSTATEINSCDFGGIALATTKSVGFEWTIPQDIDLDKAIDIRLVGVPTGAGTTEFTTVYTANKLGSGTMAVGATALDTVHAQFSNTTNQRLATNWGQIAAATVAALSLTRSDDSLVFNATPVLVTATAFTVMEVQIGYYRDSLA